MRNRLADAIALFSAVAYGAVMIPLGDATSPNALLPWQLDVAIGVACTPVLLARRDRPWRVCLILLPFGAISVMATGPILVALFTVAIQLRPRVLLPLGLAHVATGVVYFALQHDPPMAVWVDLVFRGGTTLAAIGWGLFLKAYRSLILAMHLRNQMALSQQDLRLERARANERTRIAREMHDVLAHRMSMVSLHAGALEVRTDATPAEISVAAKAIRTSAHEALDELRTVIGVLRQPHSPLREPPQPDLTDLPELISDAKAGGMCVTCDCRVLPRAPSPALGRTAYRVVQEGLTNARKHAPGARVTVTIDGERGAELRVLIVNDLEVDHYAELMPGAGLGLVGLTERVELAGGRVEFGPRPDGYRLEAWLTWPA